MLHLLMLMGIFAWSIPMRGNELETDEPALTLSQVEGIPVLSLGFMVRKGAETHSLILEVTNRGDSEVKLPIGPGTVWLAMFDPMGKKIDTQFGSTICPGEDELFLNGGLYTYHEIGENGRLDPDPIQAFEVAVPAQSKRRIGLKIGPWYFDKVNEEMKRRQRSTMRIETKVTLVLPVDIDPRRCATFETEKTIEFIFSNGD
ncbi:MAG: hypothetical protein KDM63_01335 [Verrucomicrobiae bacterium]|nr:hypothetical protein [Verrucomicrobiae bacterium]